MSSVSFFDLLFFPVTSPGKGLLFLLKAIKDHADQELGDEETLYRRLMELELLYEMDEVDERDYIKTRAEITGRLKEISENRQVEV